ncbi:MAG: hypothetical protein JST47_15065 [Bacteroidetes bacterium]|nr:hypothetical protein [Bacteroidota bacterium]MBS1974955.1 hypothetical protein [Bacteroidota bacterium]
MPHPPEGELVATTIIVGYLFAIFINAAFNILLALAFLVKKEINKIVPRWLIISNLLFLIPELIMISK